MSTFPPEAWQVLLPIPIPQGVVHINEYFARHPERMLGQLALGHGPNGRHEPAVAGTLTPDLLASALVQLPSGIYLPRRRSESNARPEAIDWGGVKDGALEQPIRPRI